MGSVREPHGACEGFPGSLPAAAAAARGGGGDDEREEQRPQQDHRLGAQSLAPPQQVPRDSQLLRCHYRYVPCLCMPKFVVSCSDI